MTGGDFERLRDARHKVAELAAPHRVSIAAFRASERAWFKVDVDEDLEEGSEGKARHKSSTASCLESLDDVGDAREADPKDRRAAQLRDEVAEQFARDALSQPGEDWKSEDAAYVYCRVRTLPAIMRFAPAVVDELAAEVEALVDYVWDEVAPEPRRQGVYEQPAFDKTNADAKQQPSYPANTFHTFWALRMLQMCAERSTLEHIAEKHKDARSIAALWTQDMLGAQVALHHVRAERADPNQLAWALIAQFVNPREPVEPGVSAFAREDLYASALDAFFGQQLDNGTWPLGQPLFHYPRAGNAYCYTYETLTELLRPALVVVEGATLRELLRPHLDRLMRAFEYARRTARPLPGDGVALGWSSGHHPHRTHSEGWATASVFSYVECLRRLLAKWTSDQAITDLRRNPSRQVAALTEDEALGELEERGNTWRGVEEWSVSEHLAALFLHPVTASGSTVDEPLDPDFPLIHPDQARSAILFGPPGTSKTTLVQDLATSIGWEFIEVRASDFLSQGMDRVPARADEIFDRLMELDHCVILFDEIDELLRERQEAETDPFGRFLTTSMLPKVAELWKQRRVVFFVATNDITHADRGYSEKPALRRGRLRAAAISRGQESRSQEEARLDVEPVARRG